MDFFEPVDHDPFAGGAPQLEPVDHDPFQEAPVTASGLYRAVDSGAASAAAGIAGLPKVVSDLGARGIQGAANYVAGKLGLPQDTRDLSQPGLIKLPTSEEAGEAIQRDLYGGAEPYVPQNRAERYAQTGGEFLLNAAMPGGAVSRAANVVLPAAATEATKELGGGAVAQAVAGLAGGMGAAKVANVAERLGATAVPSIEKGVAGNLKEVASGQYRDLEKQALAVPTSPIQRQAVSDLIKNDLHAANFRRANAPETYDILDDIAKGNKGRTTDAADLLNARRKLGNISGEDGVAAQQARQAIDQVLEVKVPGIGAQLENADKNYNAFKVAEALSAKFQKKELQAAGSGSGLNLGNKLRQGATEIATNPKRTRYMKPEDVRALEAMSAGTNTQNAIRYVDRLLGGGGGLGAIAAAGLGGEYLGGHEGGLGGGAGSILAGLALRRGYNRSIARQAQGIGQQVLARSPQAGVLGSTYIPPMTLTGSVPRGIYGGLPAYPGILGRSE